MKKIIMMFLLLGGVALAAPGKIYKYDYKYPIDSYDGWKHRIEVTATPTPKGYIAPTPIPPKPARLGHKLKVLPKMKHKTSTRTK